MTIFLFFFFTIFAFAQETRGINLHSDRYALVIGNSAYQTVPLQNPVNDAEDMTATLKEMGFTVILKKNADQRTMEDTIRHFGKQLRGGGVGLFYFAGHGMQVDGRNYLIPIDARIESESDVKYEAIDAGRVLGKMEDAENKINIVILDACRNNPFSRNFRTSERGLARMDAPKGSLIAYATAPGEIAADGTERNGIFTKYLLKNMIVPNWPIELVLKQARIDVANETNGQQIPWESSSLMGDFYFNPAKSSKLAPSVSGQSGAPLTDVSESQVAIISHDKKRQKEPWTGVWYVDGHPYSAGQYEIKQTGSEVVSTKNSIWKLRGHVEGDRLTGRIYGENQFPPVGGPFDVKISPDGKSFKGKIDTVWGNSNLRGMRKNN